MSGSSGAVLLDTGAVIWLANGAATSASATEAIVQAGLTGRVLVSPVSAWEIGMLCRKRGLQCLHDPKTWFARFIAGPGIRETALTPAIAVDASYLPGDLHGDAGDRLIIATARHLGVPVVTRDRLILAYGAAGGVGVVGC